jgi:L-alanine-DL-glutamate epimerase-like enolase superfamily enzyme
VNNNKSFGGMGVSGAIERLASALIGRDPRPYEAHVARLQVLRRPSAGGMVQQAAIENALLDVKARALQVPVYELFGGPLRSRQRVYWSHCGTYRVPRGPARSRFPSGTRWTTWSPWGGKLFRAAFRH